LDQPTVNTNNNSREDNSTAFSAIALGLVILQRYIGKLSID